MLILSYFILFNVYIFENFSESYEIIEWICVGIMLSSISIQALVSTSRSIYQMFEKLRRCRRSDKVQIDYDVNPDDTEYPSNLDNSVTQINFTQPNFYESIAKMRESC
jgi:hypothetical protein